MTTFDETLHPRATTGQFAEREHSGPEAVLPVSKEPRCSQHMGIWGDDSNCTNCATPEGTPVEYPFPPLRDGLMAHEVDVNVWQRPADDTHKRAAWFISSYRIGEDGLADVAHPLNTSAILDHQVPADIGDDGWWSLDVAPPTVRKNAVALLRVRDEDFARDFGAYLDREAAIDREYFEQHGTRRIREFAAND